MAAEITIAGRKVGPGHSVMIVAEMSANHLRNLDTALAIVRAAKEAGADCIKTQTFTADSMTMNSDTSYFQICDGPWTGRTLYELYQAASFPWAWHPHIKREAERLGLVWFSTAFDCEGVDFLETLNVPCHKVASFELPDLVLIRHMARLGKPIILSTGMATIDEIWAAIKAANEGRRDRVYLEENRALALPSEVALLKCTSAYAAPATEANLRTIEQMRYYQFMVPIGLSDHTLGIAVPVAAVALGASIVEKHLCLDRSLGGPDAAFSLEPHEFTEMVEAIRITEEAIGQVHYGPTESEKPMLRFRRSLFVVADVKAGELFMAQNVRSIRPTDGLEPRYYDDVIGKRASRAIERGTPLEWGMIGG